MSKQLILTMVLVPDGAGGFDALYSSFIGNFLYQGNDGNYYLVDTTNEDFPMTNLGNVVELPESTVLATAEHKKVNWELKTAHNVPGDILVHEVKEALDDPYGYRFGGLVPCSRGDGNS